MAARGRVAPSVWAGVLSQRRRSQFERGDGEGRKIYVNDVADCWTALGADMK